MIERRRLTVTGVVQGVGFRPFVYNLATELGLSGFVGNDGDGVFIELEGEGIREFERRLRQDAPPLAHIDAVTSLPVETRNERGFRIVESSAGSGRAVLVSPDVSVCGDCLAELADPADRRFGYPFINCTNCGPRFTITLSTPYDRPSTTMAAFTMCPACRTEYDDPADRRFHAQPNACAACGPRIWLEPEVEGDPIEAARSLVAQGRVVAVRGLGGFHLACNAFDSDAVAALRERKGRVDKPFALMVADLATARVHVHMDEVEERLLSSRQRPIVLLEKRSGSHLSSLVAPGNGYLGVMLPYTPLHHLLTAPGEVWVMTSGNLSDEPIVTGLEEARRRLSGLADAFLMHDRDIHVPCDDSVVRVFGVEEMPVRRSRGYAPFPIRLPVEVPPTLAVGGELKATFCLARDRDAFMSQHIGDMENLQTLSAFEVAVEHVCGLFRIEPSVVVSDMHPGYLSARWAAGLGLPLVRVQHHQAHVASVMAENGVTEPVIGFSFDGTGYGLDGAVWGGEVLVGDFAGFERVAHLEYVPLTGGDISVARPYRMALSHLWSAGAEWTPGIPAVDHCPPAERSIILHQLETGLNSIPTSSAGRLFDAVSALIGVRQEVNYEGQAAIELEAIADPATERRYRFVLDESDHPWLIRTGGVINELIGDPAPAGERSAAFHLGLADTIVRTATRLRLERGLEVVGLSGGVFQNAFLLYHARRGLTEAGFRVLTHSKVPPNDGGLALGQAVLGQGV